MTFFSSSACKSKRDGEGASFQPPKLSQLHTVPFHSIIQAYFRFALIKLQVTKDRVETVVLLFSLSLTHTHTQVSVFLAYLTILYTLPMQWVPVTTAWRVLRLRIEEWPPIWRVAANMLEKSRGQPIRGGPPAWGLGEGLTTPPCKTALLRNTHMQDASSGDKTIRR